MSDRCFPGTVPPTSLPYISMAISLLLFVIITLGNLSIILAVIKDPLRTLRNPFAFFLANAAVSDFVVGAVAMPVSVIFHYLESQNRINQTCIYILHLTYFISATASLVSIVAMAIDRYFTLISITAKPRKLHRRECVALSSLIWMLAIGFSGFYFLAGFVTLVYVYVNISLVSSFGITLLTYLKVLSRMRETTNALKRRGLATGYDKKDRAVLREKKVTSVFMSLLFAYIGVYFPTFILINLLQFCLSCSCPTRHVFRDLVFLFVSAASATNPIICLLKMPVLRKSLIAIAKCKDRRLSSQSSHDSAMKQIPENK